MEEWKKILSKQISDPKALTRILKANRKDVEAVAKRYPMSVNRYYLGLIRKKNDPVWRQCVPDKRELTDKRGKADPLHEEEHSPIFGLVHRYPDRALLLVSNMCATYCRFCTRKRKVGKPYRTLEEKDFKRALRYIDSHKKIRDVIISGGDPLLLDDDKLEHYLRNLKKIKHIEIIRIDSRTPCTLPQRITPKLCRMLAKYPPVYFLTHFNHPSEITKEAKAACRMLANSGIVMGNQSVLLKDINDNPKTLIKLGEELLKIKVRPYYIYIPDAVRGTAHFRVSIKRALGIMKKVIGFTSGLAVPKLIIDLESGGGKIPLSPNYMDHKIDHKYDFVNFEGKHYVYTDI